MPLLDVVFLFCLAAFSVCAETPLNNFAVYVPYADSVYMRLGPLSSLAAMGHQMDPSDSACVKFSGLYLNENNGENFPEDGYEMTVMLFKAGTKSIDLPVRFSELVLFLVEMVGPEEFYLLYGLEIIRTEKNMLCRVHASERVLDRLYKQIRAHKFCVEDFKGATMMLADKKPISIKFLGKTGANLWNLDVNHGKGFEHFGVNSKFTANTAISCLISFPEFPFAGVRLLHKETLNITSELPHIIYNVPIKYLRSFVEYPIQQRERHGELYEIQMNFGLDKIIGIELMKSQVEDRIMIKYILDSTVTEKDVKQINYFLKRSPIYDSFVNREYDLPRPFTHAVMRTSITGPTMNLFLTQGEAFMVPTQYFEMGKLPKKIEDATFIFEFKGRDIASSKNAFALVHTSPNDAFIKAALLHSTYYNFLTKHHLVQDLLYRIVIRPSDNGKSMQFIWIMNALPSRAKSEIIKIVLKEMMVFLWMSMCEKPQKVEMMSMHPVTLKALKGGDFTIFSPETVDLYMKNPVEEIESMSLNLPFASGVFPLLSESTPANKAAEELRILPIALNCDHLPKCSNSREEPTVPVLEELQQVIAVESLPTSESVPLPAEIVEPQQICCAQFAEPSSIVMNSEFEMSRLVLIVSGISTQPLASPSGIGSLLRTSDLAEFYGKVTVNPAGSIEVTLSDSLNFSELNELKRLFAFLFRGKVCIKTREKRS